ncbi:MAG: hypothetical protein JWS12_453 [Candidatus Saccharibacteria bacterium]|nr:hypothetical protein [Candidatus Saccharibacteria bacterium]
MADSIFTRIIKGEIPAHKVYEDAKTLAFLDIHPVQPGHVLVVPKAQVEQFQDLADEDFQALMATVKKVALRQKAVLRPKRVGLQVVGIDVPHVHVHLIPFNTVAEFRHLPDMAAEPDHTALAKIAATLHIDE